MYQLACKDMGFACDALFSGKTEKELEEVVGRHAAEIHGVEPSDFTPDLMRRVKANIHRV
jgi:predicted small metal-binding protein